MDSLPAIDPVERVSLLNLISVAERAADGMSSEQSFLLLIQVMGHLQRPLAQKPELVPSASTSTTTSTTTSLISSADTEDHFFL